MRVQGVVRNLLQTDVSFFSHWKRESQLRLVCRKSARIYLLRNETTRINQSLPVLLEVHRESYHIMCHLEGLCMLSHAGSMV